MMQLWLGLHARMESVCTIFFAKIATIMWPWSSTKYGTMVEMIGTNFMSSGLYGDTVTGRAVPPASAHSPHQSSFSFSLQDWCVISSSAIGEYSSFAAFTCHFSYISFFHVRKLFFSRFCFTIYVLV